MANADLIVIGAGPAGVAAALSAYEAGLNVLLLDEGLAAGGQVYRAPPEGTRVTEPGALGPDYAEGERLRAALAGSGVDHRRGHRVILVTPGFQVTALHAGGLVSCTAPALVVATGATERVVPFAGWTTPGVFGLAAATIMLKAHGVLPGQRCVVAGCGPLLAAVATGILKAGGTVAAVLDLAHPGDWVNALPAMMQRPALLGRGGKWVAKLLRSRTPLLFRHTVLDVIGATSVEGVRVARVGRDGATISESEATEIACDALLVGHGLVPNTDITRAMRARHVYAADRGGWIAAREPDMRTTVRQLYLAGDGGGISGAAAASLQGRLAGLAAARDLGRVDGASFVRQAAPIRAALARAERFGRAMSALMALRPAQVKSVPEGCVVCRCEDVTRAEIEDAVARGAREVNQVKAWTRCGMGPCQGKMCGETVAALIATHVGGREQAGAFTARPPFRPVPTEALVGTFDYDDIPIPPPAPL